MSAAFGRLCVETFVLRQQRSPVVLQPPSGGCVLKQGKPVKVGRYRKSAAFGRLCVETETGLHLARRLEQPPSGGCVLKPYPWITMSRHIPQPPSGGCVLKHAFRNFSPCLSSQPPSGGCVLKLKTFQNCCITRPAAFGRLCVETMLQSQRRRRRVQPPSGGCVLKRRCMCRM